MIPFVVSLLTAVLFLLLASATYGVGALGSNAWVAMVFWGLLGVGASVSILGTEADR